jgi:site-specific DNA recombinase
LRDEQARSGYSLAQQIEALRQHAANEGYKVLEEVSDPGQSGASLGRPGMDRVRDLVAAGGVSVVLAQDRDRFAREPAYHYLLRREFEEQGTKIRALNDRGDESPEGELTDGILDQLAKFERAKTAERTRRGKLKKAREGKIIAGTAVNYGFRLNTARDGYEIDEDKMRVVKRIFYMAGVEGRSLRGILKALAAEGVRTPTRKEVWSTTIIRNFIGDDVYKPHTYKEVAELVAPEVLARLDPERCYGIWWFNRRKTVTTQTSVIGRNGKEYKRQTKRTPRVREEWIAVPVPDAGIPRGWVDAARATTKDNRRPSANGDRIWQLSRGIFYCGECSYRMSTHTTSDPKMGGKSYYYYHCPKRRQYGKKACSDSKYYRAEELESAVWGAVSGILKDPEQLRADLDAMIKLERDNMRCDPDQETKLWANKLAEIDRRRRRYQEMAADDLITFDELRARLVELDERRTTAEQELRALQSRKEHLDELEQDRNVLLDNLTNIAPEALEALGPEERHQFYRMLRLKVITNLDGSLEMNGAFSDGFSLCKNETSSSSSSTRRMIPLAAPRRFAPSGTISRSSVNSMSR